MDTWDTPPVLTLWHHSQDKGLAGVSLKLVVGVHEDAVEDAQVGPRVVEGHSVDVDGAVLQVLGVVAAFPSQTAMETCVRGFFLCIFVAVKLERNCILKRPN